jgi:hypothetical protein
MSAVYPRLTINWPAAGSSTAAGHPLFHADDGSLLPANRQPHLVPANQGTVNKSASWFPIR